MDLADLGAHHDGGAGVATRGLVSCALDRGGLSSRPQNRLQHRVAPIAELRVPASLAGTAGTDSRAPVATAGAGAGDARAAGQRDPAYRPGASRGAVGQGTGRRLDRTTVLVCHRPLWRLPATAQ